MNKKILGIIPARGGSKGIHKKNLYPLNNKPLIQYSIEAASKSKLITDFIVSTDCKEIKKVSEGLGAIVPFIRPNHLSNDTALAIPTIQHAVLEYEKIMSIKYDYVIMLQPTAPLRTEGDIDKALSKLIDCDADGIISIVDVDNYHPHKMKIINKKRKRFSREDDKRRRWVAAGCVPACCVRACVPACVRLLWCFFKIARSYSGF